MNKQIGLLFVLLAQQIDLFAIDSLVRIFTSSFGVKMSGREF